MDACSRKALILLLLVVCAIVYLTSVRMRQKRQLLLQSLSQTMDRLNDSLSSLETSNNQLLHNILKLQSLIHGSGGNHSQSH